MSEKNAVRPLQAAESIGMGFRAASSWPSHARAESNAAVTCAQRSEKNALIGVQYW